MKQHSETGNTHSLPQQKTAEEAGMPLAMKYKASGLKTADAAVGDEAAVDFRYVPHGHGPCSCCGPYSE